MILQCIETIITADPIFCSIMLDASARRFQAQKIYLRAVAATRWANSRAVILQGQKPQAGHLPSLQATSEGLRAVRL